MVATRIIVEESRCTAAAMTKDRLGKLLPSTLTIYSCKWVLTGIVCKKFYSISNTCRQLVVEMCRVAVSCYSFICLQGVETNEAKSEKRRSGISRVGAQEIAMSESLQELLLELERFGLSNDDAITDRPRRMLNSTLDSGAFLSLLVRAMNAQRVLEIGTSNGYSTLWFALAAETINGHVTTVELSDFKVALAAKNFARSSLASFITLVHGEAGALLRGSLESSFDFSFLDSERSEYMGWWPDIKRVLRQGGLFVVDNAISHFVEMAPFAAQVSAVPGFTTCTVPVGNGEFLATQVTQ